MKKESEQVMLEAMNVLNIHSEESCCQLVFDMLAQILRNEMNETKIGKFDLRECCDKEKNHRPILQGIYHAEGYKVATNAQILAVIKTDYPDYLEGKILAKDGSFIEGKFPQYKAVIPDFASAERVKIDLQKYNDAVKENEALKKQEKQNVIELVLKIKDAFFKIDVIKPFMKFMNEYGINEVYYTDATRPLLAIAGDDSKCVVVPYCYSDENYKGCEGRVVNLEA